MRSHLSRVRCAEYFSGQRPSASYIKLMAAEAIENKNGALFRIQASNAVSSSHAKKGLLFSAFSQLVPLGLL